MKINQRYVNLLYFFNLLPFSEKQINSLFAMSEDNQTACVYFISQPHQNIQDHVTECCNFKFSKLELSTSC